MTPSTRSKKRSSREPTAESSSSPADLKRPKLDKDELINIEEEEEEDFDDSSACSPETLVFEIEKKPTRSKKATVKPTSLSKRGKEKADDADCRFIGEPIPDSEAWERWPERYTPKEKGVIGTSTAKEVTKARRHYKKAEIDGVVYNLYDDANIKGEDEGGDYIGRIVEFFEDIENESYFTAQWFFKAVDTVIQNQEHLVGESRVFYSDVRDENPLNCIMSKLNIVRVEPNINLAVKEAKLPPCDYYYDMTYSEPYSSIATFPKDCAKAYPEQELSSTISSEASCETGLAETIPEHERSYIVQRYQDSEMKLLDLYSGCGAMSTGLCLGAAIAGVKLVTRWAVDFNKYACESLKENHPETEVRNEKADDFLKLLHEWEKLCKDFSLVGTRRSQISVPTSVEEEVSDDEPIEDGEFEVGKLVSICFGDPKETGERGLYFKVSWKGFGPDEDTWEPVEGLSDCEGKIKEFVTRGYHDNIIPLPGDVDVICGGPPCQGISGFNRFRNTVDPLKDLKNQQVVVYMDIVDFLKPKYVLMENVVDILKLCDGLLGRYAFGRLVSMNYQARIGMMAAGCYGLPQYRMRMFMWGALPTENLPQYALPTHEVVARGGIPNKFEQCAVAHDKDQDYELQKALYLKDAISDLPAVTNSETRDEMPYGSHARTEFQKSIRQLKHELIGSTASTPSTSEAAMLYDHRPLQLNDDDYGRVCRIPKKKGANFRDLPGVLVNENNIVSRDTSVPIELLPSGSLLIPNYAISFIKGRSTKPFARLWWDETVPTVVTRAEPHNQRIIHPEQDRVLSIRENARLQGFPDFYKLSGPIKERYIQVGNAVAVPVARALGYALGLAIKRTCEDGPLLTLPPNFPNCPMRSSSQEVDVLDAEV